MRLTRTLADREAQIRFGLAQLARCLHWSMLDTKLKQSQIEPRLRGSVASLDIIGGIGDQHFR